MSIDLERLEELVTGSYNHGYSNLEILLMAQAVIAKEIAEELK